MALRKRYITHPERLYVDPHHPATSDYDVVFPLTTTDAVMVEGQSMNLTEYLHDVGGVKVEQRNTTIAGQDIVRVTGNTVEVGNYIVSVANGFNEHGVPQDSIYFSDTYTTVTTPTSTDNYLLVLADGTLGYCQYFNGGRDFPTEGLVTGYVYFHEQLRRAYRYDGSVWQPYPCTVLARFENGQLAEIMPYNTWWWDEVVFEDHYSDLPAGLKVSSYMDTNNDYYLHVTAGGVIDNGHIFTLPTDIYKKVQLAFSAGNEGGSGDGNYTNVMVNIIPTDITPTNSYGFSVLGDDVQSHTVYSILNPNYTPSTPVWLGYGRPSAFTIGFPTGTSYSINKYTVTAWNANSDSNAFIKSWVLLGTNDLYHWEVIDYVANAGFTQQDEVKSFHPTNVKRYSAIKMVALDGNGPAGHICIGQTRFYSSVPELNVFVITDDKGHTDILTSPYSGPTLPAGYTYYHRIGKICIGETANLFGAFPSTSIAIDAAGRYETVSNDLSKKADSTLQNLSSEATSRVAQLAAPRIVDSTAISLSSGVFYQAPSTGHIVVYNNTNATTIYNNMMGIPVSNNATNALVGGAPAGTPCTVFVAKGSFFKVVSTGAISIKFYPAVGCSL